MMARFRIRPEHVDDVSGALRDAGIEPTDIYDRDDGVVAIEVGEVTEKQSQALAANFRPEWSAIIGIIAGDPFEMKN